MIDLEQTRQLQDRVHKAIALIETLKKENEILRRKLAEYEQRVGELEVNVSSYNQEQSEIEQGILAALDQLDRLEDDIAEEGEADSRQAAPTPRSEAQLRVKTAQDKVALDPEQTAAREVAEDDSVAESSDTPGNGKLGIFR